MASEGSHERQVLADEGYDSQVAVICLEKMPLEFIFRSRVIFLDRVQQEVEIVREKVLPSVPLGKPYTAGSGQSNWKAQSRFLHGIHNIGVPSTHYDVFFVDANLFHQKLQVFLAEV
jgi:hypothetical protein